MTTSTGPAHQLSWDQALTWQMQRHDLLQRAAPSDLLRVVSDICGLHAQLMSSAELSLWARIDDLAPDALSEALWQQRALIKLWAIRGTLHLLPAHELGLWLAALGTHTRDGNAGYPGIDELTEAVAAALDGRVLSREELALAVEKTSGSSELGEWVRFSWGSYLKAASYRGKLCFAPSVGNSVRFTAPATWLNRPIDAIAPDEALREITRRFLSAYAPATAGDLALWWGGYGPPRGARMLAALGEEAIEVDVEGQRAWMLARDVGEMAGADTANAARLRPAFDPWTAGASRHTAALLEPQHKPRVYRPQGWISPVLLVNGRMAGVWKHKRQGRRLRVEIEPFASLPTWARPQVESEAERLATFFGCELELR